MSRNTILKLLLPALGSITLMNAQNLLRHQARIVLEGGAPMTTMPRIIAQDTDRLRAGCIILGIIGNGLVEYEINPYSRPVNTENLDGCDVSINLKGYKPVVVTLKQDAVITLKRIGDHEGSTVSETSLSAPKDAQKAYEHGLAAISEHKWDAAQKDLQKAVDIYPQYAQAWSTLGEVMVAQSKLPDARAAWEHAVKADPKYIKPYQELARMAIVENRAQDASEIAEKALAQSPVEFPAVYFYYAVAQQGLGHPDVAEKFARQAIELDTGHEYPRAEYLLASLLDAKGDRAGAIDHLNKYLEAAPKAADADKVRQRIAQLEQKASAN
jgi:tetratricopeptide (TPR) repeat protein